MSVMEIFLYPIATSDLKQVYDRPVYFPSRSPFVDIPEKSFTQGGDWTYDPLLASQVLYLRATWAEVLP